MSLTDLAGTPAAGRAGLGSLPASGDAAARLTTLPWTRRATLVAVAALSVFAAVAFAAWMVSGAVVPWDSKNQFYPMFRFLGDALAHGQSPFWNPYHFAGHPSIADPQSLIFTPTMLLFAIVAPKAPMQLFDAVIFAHLYAGGLGMIGLLRRWRWHPAGAVLAAMIFMLGGSASSRLQHTGIIISYSFFPLAFWALEVTLERVSYRVAALFGGLATLMALGRDQVAFLLCATMIAKVLWAAARTGAPATYLRRRIGVLGLAGFIIAAAMAVPVLLTLQFLGASNRPGIPFGVAVAGSLAPVNLATLLAPDAFGSIDWNYDYWGPGYETLTAFDWTDRAINYLFIGTIPALLLAWHGLAAGRMFARGARFFAVLATCALIYAVGRNTPVFEVIFDWLPGVSLYRRPADATFLLNIALAVTSGYLVHRFVVDGLPRPFRFLPRPVAAGLAAAAALAVLLIVGGALPAAARHQHLADVIRAFGLAAGISAAAVVLMLRLNTPTRRGLCAVLLVAATSGELIWRNAASSLNAEPIARYSIYSAPSASASAGLAALGKEIAADRRQGERPRVEMLGLAGPWQNASMVLKLENTLGYNPLRIDDYQRAVGPGENAQDPNLRHYPGTFRGYRCRLATLLGLEYLLLDRPLEKLPRHVPHPVASLVYAGDSMYVYKLGKIAPRAYFASRVKPVDDDAILDQHMLPDFDLAHEALIDAGSLDGLGSDLIDPPAGPPADAHVAITSYANTAVGIDVDTDSAGVVVLHDLYYPGWEASVDGAAAPVLRANVLFRGVYVPAGHHHVSFAFHPLSLASLAAAATELLHRNAH